jgi:predicted GIY-YIG superfamily endonuclease
MTVRRKPRCDCSYAIYRMIDGDGNFYVGLTRKTETTILKSIKRRWGKHLSRAKQEDLEWKLYKHIREFENLKWKHEIIEIVRGRKIAYAREREIILEMKPNLNTQYCKK